jgi:hypothetical protein
MPFDLAAAVTRLDLGASPWFDRTAFERGLALLSKDALPFSSTFAQGVAQVTAAMRGSIQEDLLRRAGEEITPLVDDAT